MRISHLFKSSLSLLFGQEHQKWPQFEVFLIFQKKNSFIIVENILKIFLDICLDVKLNTLENSYSSDITKNSVEELKYLS